MWGHGHRPIHMTMRVHELSLRSVVAFRFMVFAWLISSTCVGDSHHHAALASRDRGTHSGMLPASAPAPTAEEVLEVTTTLVPEAVAACVNDCVLFRHVDPRHDPDGLRAGLADLDTCPVCAEPRYVKGTTRNRKTFWYQQCLLL